MGKEKEKGKKDFQLIQLRFRHRENIRDRVRGGGNQKVTRGVILSHQVGPDIMGLVELVLVRGWRGSGTGGVPGSLHQLDKILRMGRYFWSAPGWRYNQMKSFFKKIKPLLRPLNTITRFESRCVHLGEGRHMLSQMYSLILSTQKKTIPYFVREWERELNKVLSDEQIKKMIQSTYSTSISSYSQEMAYKFLTRWYRTPARLNRIYPTADARCWRGCEQRGTFLHLWWECPRIKEFWDAVAPWIKRLAPRSIECTPLDFLFYGTTGTIKAYRRSITPHLLNAAKVLIPRFWKQNTCPTLEDWKREVNRTMEAERWIHVVKDKKGEFEDIWAGWIQCVQGID